MPLTDAYLEKVLRILDKVRPVTHRKMFGGAGIYMDGTMFAVLDNDRIFFKVDALSEKLFLSHNAKAWLIQGKPMRYRELPASVLKDTTALGGWIDTAVQVARDKKKKASKKKP